ncbi:MAG TPA: PH domain-containing protein [Egibacteraceae bacterium]|nr:PH domain-containing protein [Egibacteraceae bacterium]
MGGRLHPAALVMWPLERALPLLALAIFGVLSWIIIGVFLIFSGAASTLRYLRFSWRIEGGALVIDQGVLNRQRRVIPFDRIQSVELVRKLRHRALGVVEARVETVGGDSTEGRLEALGVEQARALRSVLLRERDLRHGVSAAAGQPEPPAPVLASMSPGRLLIAGMTGGRVGVAAVLVGIAEQVFGQRLLTALERLPGVLGVRGIILAALAILVVVFLLSVVATTVAYWDFTVTRERDALRIRRGLLQQRSDTLPLRRVQAVRVEQNLIRRAFGLAAVRADVAGRAGGNDEGGTTVLLPLAPWTEAVTLAQAVLDREGLAGAPLAPMPLRARRRRLVRAVAFVAVAAAAVGFSLGWTEAALAGVALSIPAIGGALESYRALGHCEVDGVMVARAGLLVRRTTFVPVERVQTLALARSPFQRLAGLATLELQIARSLGGADPTLIDIDAALGGSLLESLAQRVAPPRRQPSPAGSG